MFSRSLTLFFKNPSLAPQVFANLVFDYYLLFLPVLLFGFFEAEYKIALAYAVIYGASSLILRSRKTALLLPLWAGVIALSSTIGLIEESFYGYTLSVSAMLGLTIRDAQQSVFHARMSELSDSPQIFSLLTVLGMVLIPVFTMGLNIGLSFVTKGSEQIALYAQVGLSLILMVFLIREPRVVHGKSANTVEIPSGVRQICWYSFFYNSTSFPIRMIVSPLIIYTAIVNMGYDQQAISITGAIIGFIAVLGILLRFAFPSKAINNQVMMVRYHRIGILFMISVFFLAMGMQYNWWAPEMLPGVVLMVIAFQLGLEVTAKLWSLGFIGTLREMTLEATGNSQLYQVSYLYFMSMKNLGSCAGFILASGSYFLFSAPLTVVLTGITGIVFVILTINRINQERVVPGIEATAS